MSTFPLWWLGVFLKEILAWNKACCVQWLWKLWCGEYIFTVWARAYLKHGNTFALRAQPREAWGWRMLISLKDEVYLKLGSIDAAKCWFSNEHSLMFNVSKSYEILCKQ